MSDVGWDEYHLLTLRNEQFPPILNVHYVTSVANNAMYYMYVFNTTTILKATASGLNGSMTLGNIIVPLISCIFSNCLQNIIYIH